MHLTSTDLLQRDVGNQATVRLLSQRPPQASAAIGPQPKLEVGDTSDPLERQADRMADRAMQHRPCACPVSGGGGTKLRASAERGAHKSGETSTTLGARAGDSVHSVVQKGGAPLEPASRAFLESRFGVSFDSVRLHADEEAGRSAKALGARAYTLGRHVVFGANQYRPGTPSGDWLLAHELAHVVQQDTGAQSSQRVSRYAAAEAETETEIEPAPERLGDPSNDSLEAMLFRAGVAHQREQDVLEAERPWFKVSRGGKPPDFIETVGHGTGAAMGEGYGYSYSYKIRHFYAVSALEYQVSRVQTESQLARVYHEWFEPPLLSPLMSPLAMFNYPSGTNVAVDMMPYFQRAVQKQIQAVPTLAQSALVKALQLTYVGTESIAQGPCEEHDVPGHAGGNVAHNDYATFVTGGNPNDYAIRSPEGFFCQFDGRDLTRNRVVWEVKTRHEWTSDTGLARGSILAPRLSSRMVEMEAQRIDCAIAAARCGWRYLYAVDTLEVAQALNLMWGGTPRVSYVPRVGAGAMIP